MAINSFTDNLTVSVAEQAQALLGADLAFTGRKPISEIPHGGDSGSTPSARFPGSKVARAVNFAAMAYLPRHGNGAPRPIAQCRSGWPFYGDDRHLASRNLATAAGRAARSSIPSLLTSLDAKVGDTLSVGEGRFPILGTVVNVPGDVGLQMAFGARVFIATSAIAQHRPARLRRAGRARERFLKLPATARRRRRSPTAARPELRRHASVSVPWPMIATT